MLEEVNNLTVKLRNEASNKRSNSIDLAKRASEFQCKIRDTARKMMALVAELSMYQVRGSSGSSSGSSSSGSSSSSSSSSSIRRRDMTRNFCAKSYSSPSSSLLLLLTLLLLLRRLH